MKLTALVLMSLVWLTGCSRNPGIKADGVTVMGAKDAGEPAKLDTSSEVEGLEIPAGSTVRVTEYEAQPAIPATSESPAVEPEPAHKVTEVVLTGTTNWKRNRATVKADTGTVDTSVAKHKVEAQERRPLLYCAIVGVVAGLGFMYVRFQAIAVMCFIGAGAFFLAWKMSEISPWVGGLFLVAAVAGFAFYKRAEWDADGDGIPDFLQKGKPKDSE